MADAAVQFLLDNLRQLLQDNAELILGIKDQAENLLGDLGDFKAFLKEAARRRSQNEVIKELVKKIRIAVNKAEDAIDKFVVEGKLHKSKGVMNRYLDKPAHLVKVNAAAREIESIRKEVKNIRENNAYGLQALQLEDPSKGAAQRKAPVVEEDDVVGFDEEAKTIIDRLIGGSDDLEVISVFGMPGLGKTTLARKVFKDSKIEYEFFIQHWVYVSRSYDRKDIFLNILCAFTQNTKDCHDMSEEQLAEKISKSLEGKKYLIVLDDVWEEIDWRLLKIAFPNNKKSSRVLLTTRQKHLASRVTCIGEPHGLKFLTSDESWELLQKKVFRKESCPPELEKAGEMIAIKCEGLPLAIVVIAGVLLDKGDRSTEWDGVAKSVSTYLNIQENCKKLVELSYDHLPYDLKSCFLYFGAFPGGYEIATWKLIRLWIAEGFIQHQGQLTLEDIAEGYLNDLVNRNLVIVIKRRKDGRIKTCRMHDMLHEFCKTEAKEENLLREIKIGGNEPLPSTGEMNTIRRLCIHSNVVEFLNCSAMASGEHVRSFMCSSSKEMDMPREHIQTIPKTYKLLRVLEMRPIKLNRLPKEMTQLFHLRYIALSSDIERVPNSIGNLSNMQTFIIKTSKRTLDFEADIWGMQRLRHFHTNTCTSLPSPQASKSSKDRLITGSLQTLSTISPESCTEEVLTRTPNLKKLGIRGKLSSLVDGRGPSTFDNIGKLDCLENLKLLNDVFLGQTGKLRGLPQAYKFPSKLKKLTISNTSLEWKDMSILGALENLEVLKLDDNAFKGELWDPVSGGGFRHLQVLFIGRTDLVIWRASSHHFPRLKFLALKHCTKLEEVPLGLADVLSLQMMELYCTNKSAAESARKIQQKKQKKQEQEGAKSGGFKLSIYPPDH